MAGLSHNAMNNTFRMHHRRIHLVVSVCNSELCCANDPILVGHGAGNVVFSKATVNVVLNRNADASVDLHGGAWGDRAVQQVVPHITDALQDWIVDVSKKPVDDSDCEVRSVEASVT